MGTSHPQNPRTLPVAHVCGRGGSFNSNAPDSVLDIKLGLKHTTAPCGIDRFLAMVRWSRLNKATSMLFFTRVKYIETPRTLGTRHLLRNLLKSLLRCLLQSIHWSPRRSRPKELSIREKERPCSPTEFVPFILPPVRPSKRASYRHSIQSFLSSNVFASSVIFPPPRGPDIRPPLSTNA